MPEPSLEPLDHPPACRWCDGCGQVEVVAIIDAWSNQYWLHDGTELLAACAHCEGTGAEPPPDPGDLALARARQKGFEHD